MLSRPANFCTLSAGSLKGDRSGEPFTIEALQLHRECDVASAMSATAKEHFYLAHPPSSCFGMLS